MYAFNSEFRNSLGVRRVRWRESAVIMLRRAGASATSLAPLLWPARSPLHYHKLLSAEAAAGNGWRSRYIYGSVEVGSAEIWLRCLISEPEKAIHPIVMQVLKQTVARRCSASDGRRIFPRWNCGGADPIQNHSGKGGFMTSTYSPKQRLSRRFSTCTTTL